MRVRMLRAMMVVLVLMVVAGGCATDRYGVREVIDAVAKMDSARDGTAATQPGRGRYAVPVAASVAPTGTMLHQLITEALARNPEIHAAAETVRSRAERIGQVTALADPMLMTKTQPEPTPTAGGDIFFILGVQQNFPIPEKLDRRGRIAYHETLDALRAWEQARLYVIAEVKRAYYRLYVLDRTIALTEENQALLRGLVEVAQGQAAAGRAPQQDALRAQVESSNLESKLLTLHQQRSSSAAMLNTLVRRDPLTEVPTPPDFDPNETEHEVKGLLAVAAEANPELRAFEDRLERDRQALRLAELAYWPDFTLGFEWMSMQPRDAFEPPINPATGMRPPVNRMSEEGADMWGILFGVTIPIWFDKIEAGIREARHKLEATVHQRAATRDRIGFRIVDALERVGAQQRLARLIDTEIVPQSRQAYDVSRDGYAVGANDFEAVINNWQRWYAFSVEYHRALGELERSVADLELELGMSLADAALRAGSREGASR
jgi:outer membrane protein TolC